MSLSYGLDTEVTISFEDYVKDEFKAVRGELRALRVSIDGNGHKGLKQIVEQHTSYFRVLGGSLVLLVPIILFIAPHITVH